MRIYRIVAASLAASIFLAGSAALAQDKPAPKDDKPAPKDEKKPPKDEKKPEAKDTKTPPKTGDEGMGGMEESMMPGPIHKQMAKRVGEWSIKSVMKMPGMEGGMESTGTSKITSVLDGRFLQEESSGTMMEQPYTAMKMWGYNGAAKQYESTWVYTMSTGMLTMAGTSTDGGKTVKYVASHRDGPGDAEKMDITLTQKDDDTFVIEMKMPGGEEGPVMTTTYTRKKGGAAAAPGK